ncbi:MAG: RDD family protein, partial [Candidatus Bathyarchaeia archaeon]
MAYLIDSIIVGLISYSLSLFASATVAAPFYFLPKWLSWISFFNFSLHGILLFLYWTLMDGIYGQSIGKMAMSLRVTTTDGKPITMSQAALESV